MGARAALLQSVGRVNEAGMLADRVAARLPLSPLYQYRTSLSLWSRGRLGDADRMIERAFKSGLPACLNTICDPEAEYPRSSVLM